MPPTLVHIGVGTGVALIIIGLAVTVSAFPRHKSLNTWGPWVLIVGGPILGLLWLYLGPFDTKKSEAAMDGPVVPVTTPPPAAQPLAVPPEAPRLNKPPKYLKDEAELIIKSLSSVRNIIREHLGNGFNQYEFDPKTLRLGAGGWLVPRSDPQFYMTLLKGKRDRLIEIRTSISKAMEETGVALRPLYGLPEIPKVSDLISPGENFGAAMQNYVTLLNVLIESNANFSTSLPVLQTTNDAFYREFLEYNPKIGTAQKMIQQKIDEARDFL
jgi:hypothetical protein